mmetsp:Transcript_27157/g.48005  ORF Transcript_27157/g.48005 Transcript_27157/m.48005 type:complete len:88 (-) Transcript_27157:10-273(-)
MNIKIVHFKDPESEVPTRLEEHVAFLDRAYPKYKIDLVIVNGTFSPVSVQALSDRLEIPKNRMFMACPNADFAETVASLGGVRVITH